MDRSTPKNTLLKITLFESILVFYYLCLAKSLSSVCK